MAAPLQVIALYGASVITPAQARRIIGSNARTLGGGYKSPRVVVDCAVPADILGALEKCVALSGKHTNAPMLVSATVVLPGEAHNSDHSPNEDFCQKISDISDLLRSRQLILQYHPGTLIGPSGPYSTASVTGNIGDATLRENSLF